MKTNLIATLLLAAAASGAPVMAQTRAADPTASAAPSTMAKGEVRKIDKATRKITIKHGEITNLDMPPMTMVFQVRDPALLDMVKVGDKVQFSAETTAGGALVVTSIRAMP
jgi:Cu(I)/Ag(I) efflux system periplasmic protein CusF